MTALLIFSATLLVAVLLSDLADRTILSTAVLFLAAGFVAGRLMPAAVDEVRDDETLQMLVTIALFSVLFTDGMRVGIRDLTSAWHLPGRALLFGMPLNLGLNAVAAHLIVGLPWAPSFLVGAVLAPTDPVFAAAIVGREDVPLRLRRLLNVESGLNDGLALPVVLLLMRMIRGTGPSEPSLLVSLGAGLLLGVALPCATVWLGRTPAFGARPLYEPLSGLSVGLVILSIAELTGANAFLAAFAAGVTIATVGDAMREAFERFGNLVTELLKLAALLALGALVTPSFFTHDGLRGIAFAVVVLAIARPVAVVLAMIGGGMARRELVAAAWFGPKGFASVAYGLLVRAVPIEGAERMFDLIGLVVIVSIVAHSSTDVLVARWVRSSVDENGAGSEVPDGSAPDRP